MPRMPLTGPCSPLLAAVKSVEDMLGLVSHAVVDSVHAMQGPGVGLSLRQEDLIR